MAKPTSERTVPDNSDSVSRFQESTKRKSHYGVSKDQTFQGSDADSVDSTDSDQDEGALSRRERKLKQRADAQKARRERKASREQKDASSKTPAAEKSEPSRVTRVFSFVVASIVLVILSVITVVMLVTLIPTLAMLLAANSGLVGMHGVGWDVIVAVWVAPLLMLVGVVTWVCIKVLSVLWREHGALRRAIAHKLAR